MKTCHIDTTSNKGMSCDECGAVWTNYMKAFSNPVLGSGYSRTAPNFCPNCGALNTGAYGWRERARELGIEIEVDE